MKRRDFIKATAAVSAVPFVLNGTNIYAEASPIGNKLAEIAAANDKVIVLIQLSGGNDGLNTVIPLDQYSNLSKARENLLIDEKKVLRLNDKTGLNPAMSGLFELYNSGQIAVIQSVGYPQQNFSHFRSTDIWTTASDSNQVITNGWLGRYLEELHPYFPESYPNTDNPDPLSITVGSVVSQTCQGTVYSMGMPVANTKEFYNVRSNGEDTAPNNLAGSELSYVRDILATTKVYNQTLQNAANKGKNLSTKYPTTGNKLSDQLKIVAQLLAGGIKTRVFVTSLGGFDTHALQNQADGDELGSHYTLLSNVSTAIQAFQDDLKLLNLDDRVIGFTFSEFGRRIKSNQSIGTDHGAAAPLFVFGKNVIGGVYGNNPTIGSNVSVNDNIAMQFDFRQIYSTVLLDWLESGKDLHKKVMLKDFDFIPFIKKSTSSVNSYNTFDISVYPNPIKDFAILSLNTMGGNAIIDIFDLQGNRKMTLLEASLIEGSTKIPLNISELNKGIYFVKAKVGIDNYFTKIVVER
jgi:uncharacterized protein (DUF1501 family)